MKLILTLILTTTALAAHAVDNTTWAREQAAKIHPEIKVQKIDNSVECREIFRNLKGPEVILKDEWGTAKFIGKLNSKGQYIEMHCNGKNGNWAYIAPKQAIDGLLDEQEKRQSQKTHILKEKVKGSGIL